MGTSSQPVSVLIASIVGAPFVDRPESFGANGANVRTGEWITA